MRRDEQHFFRQLLEQKMLMAARDLSTIEQQSSILKSAERWEAAPYSNHLPDLVSDYSTYGHKLDNGGIPPGLFDGLVWIPQGNSRTQGWLFMNNEYTITGNPSGSVTKLRYDNGAITGSEVWVDKLARPCSSYPSPWGTVLTNEEDDAATDGSYGHVVEIDPFNKANVKRHKAMGRMGHENTMMHPRTLEFFTTDDSRPTSNKGAIYKFVPEKYGDLSKGKLYAFRTDGGVLAASSKGTWVEITNPDNAQREAFEKGATLYDRPEDLQYNPVDGLLYILMTGDSNAPDVNRRLGAIYRLNAVTNVMERWLVCDGNPMAMPDNIEIDPQGNLWVAEDRDAGVITRFGNNQLILVRPDKTMEVVMWGKDPNGEVSGILWRPDGKGFWVEWQHGKDPSGVKAAGQDYDELYEVTLPARLQGEPRQLYASARDQKHRAVLSVTLHRDGSPASGLDVQVSRSISGRAPFFRWKGRADAKGQVRIEIAPESRFTTQDVNGYYRVQAVNPTSEAVLSAWPNIPIRGGRELMVTLTIGGAARLDAEYPLAPEAGVAAKPTVNDQDEMGEAHSFELGTNTPNPFNPSTQIGFRIPESGEVSLRIYNLHGQVVRELVAGHREAGVYQVTWDGRDTRGRGVSSGVYFYRLEAGAFSQTRRMLLLK